MGVKAKAAQRCGNITTPKTSTRSDKRIISDYERGTWYAGLAMFGMFVFFIGWMWFTW